MNPTGENRERDYEEGAENPSPDQMWRLTKSPRLGGILNPETQIVRSNHFKGLSSEALRIALICSTAFFEA